MTDLPIEKKSPVGSLVVVVGAIAVVIAVLAHVAPPETPAQLAAGQTAKHVHDQALATCYPLYDQWQAVKQQHGNYGDHAATQADVDLAHGVFMDCIRSVPD
jgi:hypothetical protein